MIDEKAHISPSVNQIIVTYIILIIFHINQSQHELNLLSVKQAYTKVQKKRSEIKLKSIA